MQSGDLIAAITALWWSLRHTAGKRDLRGYALLYAFWLECRDAVARSPLFHRAAGLLYAHTADWFGQVDVQLDPYASPLQRPEEFFESVRRVIANLRDEHRVTPASGGLWDSFHLCAEVLKRPLAVKPRSDVAAFMSPGLAPSPRPVVDRAMANPLPELPTRGGVHDFDWTMAEFFQPRAIQRRQDMPGS